MGKIKIQCPNCDKVYRIKPEEIPERNVKITCKSCGTKIKLKRKKEKKPAPSKDDIFPDEDPEKELTETSRQTEEEKDDIFPNEDPLEELTETSSQTEEEIEDLSSPIEEEVTCPECGHSFDFEEGVSGEEAAGQKQIIVVDDQDFFIDYTHDILGEDYRMDSANTVEDAINKINNQKPDLLILDLAIHGQVDGKDVLKAIEFDIPVIILTGMAESDLMGELWEELEELGANKWVGKGIDIDEELRLKTEKLLGER